MLYYNDGKFNYKQTSFKIPNGMGLETEPETINEDKMELVAPDRSFILVLHFSTASKKADEFLFEVYDIFDESELEILERVHRIETTRGLVGYHTKYIAAYKSQTHVYDEYVFELPDGDMLNIYLKTFRKLEDPSEYERVKKELLDGLEIK